MRAKQVPESSSPAPSRRLAWLAGVALAVFASPAVAAVSVPAAQQQDIIYQLLVAIGVFWLSRRVGK